MLQVGFGCFSMLQAYISALALLQPDFRLPCFLIVIPVFSDHAYVNALVNSFYSPLQVAGLKNKYADSSSQQHAPFTLDVCIDTCFFKGLTAMKPVDRRTRLKKAQHACVHTYVWHCSLF